jgi:hypothetical protein
MPRPMRAGSWGHLVGWPGGVSSTWLLPFGVPQACDEIAGDADCHVVEGIDRILAIKINYIEAEAGSQSEVGGRMRLPP